MESHTFNNAQLGLETTFTSIQTASLVQPEPRLDGGEELVGGTQMGGLPFQGTTNVYGAPMAVILYLQSLSELLTHSLSVSARFRQFQRQQCWLFYAGQRRQWSICADGNTPGYTEHYSPSREDDARDEVSISTLYSEHFYD